jgi:hypothetical protein
MTNKTLQATGALMAATTLAGCNGAFWGNILVVFMTFGVFIGTLSLGRASAAARSAASSTQSTKR